MKDLKQKYIDYLKNCDSTENKKISAYARTLAFDEKTCGLSFDREHISSIAKDTLLPKAIRFGAWYTLFLSMRRFKTAPDRMTHLIEEYQKEFGEIPLFRISLSIMLAKQQEYLRAVSMAESALEIDSTNLGFMATYVDIAISWVNSSSDVDKIDPNVWRKTKRLITILIDQNPKYAKYQYYYSQYLLFEKQLEEAERRILLAIDIENEESSDYFLRLSDYQAHYLKVRTAILELELNEELKTLAEANKKLHNDQQTFRIEMQTMKTELKETQRQSFQFITVFIAVISILLSSIKAFTFSDTEQLVQFMLVMSLSLLLFFSTLFGLVTANKTWLRVVLVFTGVLSSTFLLYEVI